MIPHVPFRHVTERNGKGSVRKLGDTVLSVLLGVTYLAPNIPGVVYHRDNFSVASLIIIICQVTPVKMEGENATSGMTGSVANIYVLFVKLTRVPWWKG